jgi:adiponectin receptor
MLNHMYEITDSSTDSPLRQRIKDPGEKPKLDQHLGSVNGSSIARECKSTGAALLAWAEIEPWRQYNRFIIRSYRPASNSYLKSISSLGYIHDQTVNIYSHLLGAVGFVAAGYILYGLLSPRYHSATWADVAVFGAFAVGLFMCLTLSAAFHTFNNHSRNVYDLFFMFDMLGISFLIMGSFYPSIYYSFYCEPGPRYLYWAMVCLWSTG